MSKEKLADRFSAFSRGEWLTSSCCTEEAASSRGRSAEEGGASRDEGGIGRVVVGQTGFGGGGSC